MAKAKESKKTDDVKTVKKEKAEIAQVLSPFQEMEREIDSMFRHGGHFPFRNIPNLWSAWESFEGKMPSVDMIDQKDNILIKAELPGVDKKDVDVSVTDHTLTIKGKTGSETEEDKGNYYRREISSGAYERVLALPGNVDTSKVKAKFRDGVLRITLPKSKKTSNSKVTVE